MTDRRHPVDLARLQRAASHLPETERQVLMLSARLGLSYEAIGERLGLSPEAVESALADALYHLDRNLRRAERPWWRLW